MSDRGSKPVLLSGIQPSGNLMIGNYIGSLRNWVHLQREYDCLFVLVDLHAITVRQDPAHLFRRCYEFLSLYIACGIDPQENTIYVQSHVSGHSQLAWILNCFSSMGELNRMTQFKDKSLRHSHNLNAGLFDYPVLMAADILLYGTAVVPVGEDQKQHLELARNLAERFNNLYGTTFTVPEPYIPKVGARIMSLQNPELKMSKSDDNANNYIALLDPPDIIKKKVQRAVTDSGREITYDAEKPGLRNLLTIYSVLADKPIEAIVQQYQGRGYGQLKSDLADVIIETLRPIQDRYSEISSNKDYIHAILLEGAERARARSEVMLRRVHNVLGFIPKHVK